VLLVKEIMRKRGKCESKRKITVKAKLKEFLKVESEGYYGSSAYTQFQLLP
jgi:hypothetical protein